MTETRSYHAKVREVCKGGSGSLVMYKECVTHKRVNKAYFWTLDGKVLALTHLKPVG